MFLTPTVDLNERRRARVSSGFGVIRQGTLFHQMLPKEGLRVVPTSTSSTGLILSLYPVWLTCKIQGFLVDSTHMQRTATGRQPDERARVGRFVKAAEIHIFRI